MTTNLTHYHDLIDSRDVIARIDELQDDDERDSDDQGELDELLALQEQAAGYSDWEHGATLIRESYFETYAQEMAEDCYDMPDGWPFRCIDWEQAARELAMDYTNVEFNGTTYYIQ